MLICTAVQPKRPAILIRRLSYFIAVGLFVFVADITLLDALSSPAALTLLSARLISVPAAATAGWFLHRHIAFSDRRRRQKARQWSHYLLVNLISGATN